MAEAAVIYVGGPTRRQAVPDLEPVALRVAADAGFAVARALGHTVDVVVGDLDSVRPEHLSAATAAGAEVIRHPVDKDRTDLELALDLVASRPGIERVVLLGGSGGRLDHLVANLAVVARPTLAPLEVDAYLGPARVQVVRSARRLGGAPGLLVSLVAWGGPASGVTTSGLRWELDGAVLDPTSGRGTSNAFVGHHADVEVTDGVLLVTTPDVSSLHPVHRIDPEVQP